MRSNQKEDKILDALLGVAVADAVGVPYEFKSRDTMDSDPAVDMVGYGTYGLPEGTWSDDSSLTFCLAESLIDGYKLEDMAKKFIAWKNENYWTPRGDVFDIGNTTAIAIDRLNQLIYSKKDNLKFERFLGEENENGNGSLMRIIPLLFYIKGKPIKEQFEIIWEVSALTHRHIRAAMSCMIYLKMAEYLLKSVTKSEAMELMKKDILMLWKTIDFAEREKAIFKNIIEMNLPDFERSKIESSGYVIHSLEAAIWCFFNTENYKDAILKAVNLGNDTDTTAAITGGLAGIYYGLESIPSKWIEQIARLSDIKNLSKAFSNSILK